ncbi:MAG: molybdopterin guanine dinucleotide synthesis [Pseudomonadota bacterium]
MSQFDTHIMVDWSGGNDAGPTPKKDAIWACICQNGVTQPPVYLRNRQLAEQWLTDAIETELSAARRVCMGFDFPFGYPRGFGQAVTGSDDPLALWEWFATHIEDSPTANNRCAVASDINARFEGIGPFWGNPFRAEFEHLPRKGNDRTNRIFAERRSVEQSAKGSFTCWQMSGAGAVGSQVMMGLPVLHRLCARFADQVSIWPFETLDRPVAFVEIWPSLVAGAVADQAQQGEIKDAAQVRVLATCIAALDRKGRLAEILNSGRSAQGEGWILGVGFEAEMAAAARSLVHV